MLSIIFISALLAMNLIVNSVRVHHPQASFVPKLISSQKGGRGARMRSAQKTTREFAPCAHAPKSARFRWNLEIKMQCQRIDRFREHGHFFLRSFRRRLALRRSGSNRDSYLPIV